MIVVGALFSHPFMCECVYKYICFSVQKEDSKQLAVKIHTGTKIKHLTLLRKRKFICTFIEV